MSIVQYSSYVLNQLDTSKRDLPPVETLGTLQPGALVFLQAVDP